MHFPDFFTLLSVLSMNPFSNSAIIYVRCSLWKLFRSTRDHSIQFFRAYSFSLLVVNTLIQPLIGGISRNFIKHQNMLHLEDSIHIYAGFLKYRASPVESVLCTVLLATMTIWQSSIPLWFHGFSWKSKKLRIDFTEFQYQMDSPITFFIETRDIPHFINASSLPTALPGLCTIERSS